MDEARPGRILVVEDERDHVELMRLAVATAGLSLEIDDARDGAACLAHLRGESPGGPKPRPDLVLMDVNMPRMNGPETVEALRADPRFRTLVVIALSTSADPLDVRRMYQAGCNAYLVKPLDFDRFVDMLRQLHAFWFGCVVIDRGEPRRPLP
jgi:chemotaxis family two-component system response regulator Rcp1